jgi:hypothetical protein
MDMSSPEWEKWNHFHPEWNQRDRYPLAHVVIVERSVLYVVGSGENESGSHKMLGLTVNVSSGGLCLLADWMPKVGEIFRIHLPLSTASATTPTLAVVRWVRTLPFEESGLSMVGLQFMV